MASGLTHILLTKKLQDQLPDGKLKNIIAFGSDAMQVGAVAPDIPYASIVDNDIFHSHCDLADNFHYEQTNQIPLRALDMLKQTKGSTDLKTHYYQFCFYLGYISHVFGDGIIHPFVRDKVGDYKENAATHRGLELQLDVVLLRYLTAHTGLDFEINYTKLQNELLNFAKTPGVSEIVKTFSVLIGKVYQKSFTEKEILGWIKGLYRLFALAKNDLPSICRGLKCNTVFYKNFKEIDVEEVTTLRKPKDREHNFLNKTMISFLDDCVPQYFRKFDHIAQRAYDYVYCDGQPVTEAEIPMIDLDTGRLLSKPGLDEVPVFWINN